MVLISLIIYRIIYWGYAKLVCLISLLICLPFLYPGLQILLFMSSANLPEKSSKYADIVRSFSRSNFIVHSPPPDGEGGNFNPPHRMIIFGIGLRLVQHLMMPSTVLFMSLLPTVNFDKTMVDKPFFAAAFDERLPQIQL